MIKYEITEGKGGRIIVVNADDLQRYALHTKEDIEIEFQRVGSQAIAVTTGQIMVYRKPTGLAYHKEYMKHNARSLWLGFTPRFDRLARNMYEYEKTI